MPRIYNVLFLCTGNSARSVLAESILRKDGGERFRASDAAGEICPLWPGQPMTAHWGIEDPAIERTDIQKEAAFVAAFRYLKNRISVFLALPIGAIDKIALGSRLREIGRMEGAAALLRKAD